MQEDEPTYPDEFQDRVFLYYKDEERDRLEHKFCPYCKYRDTCKIDVFDCPIIFHEEEETANGIIKRKH